MNSVEIAILQKENRHWRFWRHGRGERVTEWESQAQRCHSRDDAFHLSHTCCVLEYLKDENRLSEVCFHSHLWQFRFAPEHGYATLSQLQATCLLSPRAWGWICWRILKSISHELSTLRVDLPPSLKGCVTLPCEPQGAWFASLSPGAFPQF